MDQQHDGHVLSPFLCPGRVCWSEISLVNFMDGCETLRCVMKLFRFLGHAAIVRKCHLCILAIQAVVVDKNILIGVWTFPWIGLHRWWPCGFPLLFRRFVCSLFFIVHVCETVRINLTRVDCMEMTPVVGSFLRFWFYWMFQYHLSAHSDWWGWVWLKRKARGKLGWGGVQVRHAWRHRTGRWKIPARWHLQPGI